MSARRLAIILPVFLMLLLSILYLLNSTATAKASTSSSAVEYREDFNGDGNVNIADVIALLLLGRDNPNNPRADYNGDGRFAVNDAIALLLNIMSGNLTPEIEPGKPPFMKLFSPDSPFNQKISPDAEIDPNSDLMVESLKDAYAIYGLYIGIREFTVTLFYAYQSTPRYDVTLTEQADWAIKKKMLNVPIPDEAFPDPEEDGEMAIIDLSTGYEYDFWQAKKEDGKWSASWANRISIYSDGIYEKALSCRGAGFALLAGLIWPEELRDGKIEHALVFTYEFTKKDSIVWPATETDGDTESEKAIPEGARVQLDPDLDLDSLNLEPWEKTIAKALQEYGMVLCDDGGGFELEAINVLSYDENPYVGLLEEEEGYAWLRSIPVDRFRVLKLKYVEGAEPGVDESIYSDRNL